MTTNRKFTAALVLVLGIPFALTLVKLVVYLQNLAN